MGAAIAERKGTTVCVRGELDCDSVTDLWESTPTLFQAGPIHYVDLSGVCRSNSAGVALMVEWLWRARAHQWPLTFINVPPQMRAIMAVTALETLLPLSG